MAKPLIRVARPGDEQAIHDAHMRSIREICAKDHGEEEVRGWGNRPLGERWTVPIREGYVWVVEYEGKVHGHGYISINDKEGRVSAYIGGLYLTPEVLHQGLGAELTRLMLVKARELRAKSVTLHSTITAHEFYRRMGFLDSGPMEVEEVGGYPVRCFPMLIRL